MMMTTTVSQLRHTFLDFFAAKGHQIVPSSPLVPAHDPTLLFTNAGMVQFKNVFLGLETPAYTRAASCQRCVRAGGKHNDLENVGYTARHHTFFEMLGNFSFGDYFKREAIEYAWEFLTETLGLPAEKLWVTVYHQDEEAAHIWLNELKVDPKRFSRCGEKDNFWSMGETGPCGPCSEIFYDHGPEIAGGPPGSDDDAGDRYIEIWNLVFMQYDRDSSGQLSPLPKPAVDTGMGLERLAAVIQQVHSNYEIDLFERLIQKAAAITQCQHDHLSSLRVLADHIRACAFLIADGVMPANEGRGYVLRRIIRRAVRHGHQLGQREPFFYQLVEQLDAEMGAAYPELRQQRSLIERVLQQEEDSFAQTLDRGLRLLEQAIIDLEDRIPGEIVFKLYDTYGFPIDLTADIARERGLSLDLEGFEKRMALQRTLSRETGQFKQEELLGGQQLECESTFVGYEHIQSDSIIVALFDENQSVEQLHAGQRGRIVLAHTPFYAESGGQVGDKGTLIHNNSVFEVEDTQKMGSAHVHLGILTQGQIQVGDHLKAQVDIHARQATARNHSATHLLHAALRQQLGTHVTQKGSLVDAERLRFDFAHFEPLTPQQLIQIEHLVNQHIMLNHSVQTQLMHLEEALAKGAMALFGEKYEQQVRVLSMGEFSTELCGGTHVRYTGDIGLFKIVAESGIAAGVRRIEAITGHRALEWVSITEQRLNRLATLLKTHSETLEERLTQMLEQYRQTEKELARLQTKLAHAQGSDLSSQAIDIEGIKVIAAQLDHLDAKQLRSTLDQLKNKLAPAAIVLATVKENKIALIAGVTPELTERLKANDLVNHVAQQVGGKGGGRADMAQAGGNNPAPLPQALTSVPEWVREQL